jgi:DNA-binding NarL/FixJ family response regulator
MREMWRNHALALERQSKMIKDMVREAMAASKKSEASPASKRGRPLLFSEKEAVKIYREREKGRSVADIAYDYGVAKNTIRKYIAIGASHI